MGRVYLHLGYIHHFSLVTLCRLQKECINHSLYSNRSSRRADFTGQVTCFFAFVPRTVFLLCFSFIVCGVLPTGVLWLHIPHTLTLRYVTFVCNNTLDILPDVRYRVFFSLYRIVITASYGWTITWMVIRTVRWKIPRYVLLLSAFAWATCVYVLLPCTGSVSTTHR